MSYGLGKDTILRRLTVSMCFCITEVCLKHFLITAFHEAEYKLAQVLTQQFLSMWKHRYYLWLHPGEAYCISRCTQHTCTYAPSRKLTQMSAVALSHNYMSFFKECPIPISSVPISSTSGTSKSTGLTLTLQLYQKLNEIRQKTF